MFLNRFFINIFLILLGNISNSAAVCIIVSSVTCTRFDVNYNLLVGVLKLFAKSYYSYGQCKNNILCILTYAIGHMH